MKLRRLILRPEDLKESMRQNWSNNGNDGWYDQFGFEIIRGGGKQKLYWKDQYITETHTLGAAKEISLILINDKIHGTKI